MPAATKPSLTDLCFVMLSAVRIAIFLLLILCFIVPVWLVHMVKARALKSAFLKCFYYLTACSWAIKVVTQGELAKDRPLLLVSNHCTYLDVPVLGSLMPVRFTPKADVRSWPLIGYLCELADCVFIDRRRTQTAQNKKNLEKALQSGIAISIFPEGTTNDGRSLQPFRSSYFSLAEEEAAESLTVQPVTVRYKHPDGSPLGEEDYERIAWYGDAEFAGHLWAYLKGSTILAEVVFHPPVKGRDFDDRKALAHYCEQQVAGALL